MILKAEQLADYTGIHVDDIASEIPEGMARRLKYAETKLADKNGLPYFAALAQGKNLKEERFTSRISGNEIPLP